MRVKTLALAGLVLWTCSTVSVFAQDGQLKFLSRTDTGIVFIGLDEDAAKCGITKRGLDSAVRLPMSRYGFNPEFDSYSHSTFFQVGVNAFIRTDIRHCTVNITLEVCRLLSIPESDYFVLGVTWKSSDLFIGDAMEIGQRITYTLENQTNKLMAAWLIDNPQ